MLTADRTEPVLFLYNVDRESYDMKNRKVMKISGAVSAAVTAAALMTVLGEVPPLSYLYDWAESSHMMFVWNGLTAGVTALCVTLYYNHLKNTQERNERQTGSCGGNHGE